MNGCLHYPQGIWRTFIRRPFLREEELFRPGIGPEAARLAGHH